MTKLKVAFAGTPEFAALALRAILSAGHEVPLVLTQPDRPAGRGLLPQASAVKALALQHQLPLAQPRSLRLDGKYPDAASDSKRQLEAAQPDVLVVAAYGLILPQWLLDLPRLGCLNIHASLLPRWRGAAPIHRAIEAGDTETGITIMQMDAGLDTGAMLLVERVAISDDASTATLHDTLAALGGRLIVQTLAEMVQSTPLVPLAQPKLGITYAHKIDKREAALDFSQPAEQLACKIRAFDAAPGCSARWQPNDAAEPELLKLWHAQALSSAQLPSEGSGQPGQVLRADAHGVVIACGQGALNVTELQRPGGKRLNVAAFLQGVPLRAGCLLF